jgi:hypothetical protein
MKLPVVALTALCLGAVALAADDDRAKLTGTWQSSSGSETWVLQDKGETWHIAYTQGNQKPAEFDCAADGRDCNVKEAGHAAKVSLYFNGPRLVELETKGAEVIKRRFAVGQQGDQMDVEVIPVVSTEKAATVHFKRVSATASK